MIAVIDYNAGNLTSVRLAFEALRADVQVTRDPAQIAAAERVVFPGVGAAGAAMHHIADLSLLPVIRAAVERGVPFLGICLGTQIIFSRSEEDGGVETLGVLPGEVRRFRPESLTDKVPQMGWNGVRQVKPHPIFRGIDDESEFYFVHSYYPDPFDADVVIGTTTYANVTFASAVASGNVVATQFHPEKSGRIGLRLLENFLAWDGRWSC